MGCGAGIARVLLIIFNVIFCLSGAGLLGVGIWLLVDLRVGHHLNVFASEAALLQYGAYVLIGVGCFVFIVGFFGCCGAIKKNRCLLGTYIFLLVIVMALELAAGILGVIFRNKIEGELEEKLLEAFATNYNGTEGPNMAFTTGLNYLQATVKCCGITGPINYPQNLTAFSDMYPVSCCKLKPDVSPQAPLKPTDAEDYDTCKMELAAGPPNTNVQAYQEGCIKGMKSWVEEHARILIGIGIGIACLEIFGFIFAVCLCCSIDKDNEPV